MTHSRFGFWQTTSPTLLLVLFLTLSASPGSAQVTADGTTPLQINSINALRDDIRGGVIRGINLFHSFQQFDIAAGHSVYFESPAGIFNIFSRVTGGFPSKIDGTLGVFGATNLFFVNPNGIIFGKDAILDIKGSFGASTAQGFVFTNGERFSTADPTIPTLLTVDVNAPIDIQFEGGQPAGDITSAGKIVTIDTPKVALNASGHVKIGDIQSINKKPLEVDIRSAGNIIFVNRITTYGGSINASSSNGSIMVDGGELDTKPFTDPASPFELGGNISLTAKSDINIAKLSSQGGSITLTTGQGDIRTSTLKKDGFQINSSGKQGGAVTISAPQGSIQLGNIETQAFPSSDSAENGGSISLTAQGDISTGFLESVSSVTYQGGTNAYTRNGGSISVNSRSSRG